MTDSSIQNTRFTGYQILLTSLFVFILFTIVVDYMTLPALSAILLPDLKLTTEQFGLIVSAYAFSAGISGLLATGFADKYDRKRLLLVYYGGFLAGMVLCATADSLIALVVARVISGLFGGVVASVCFAVISDLFAVDLRGRVMGFVQMAFAGGQVAGLPLALYLAARAEWHSVYWAFFGMGSIIFTVVLFKMKPVVAHLAVQHKGDIPLRHSLRLFGRRDYWAVFLNNILIVLGDVMFMTFGSAYSTNNLGVSLEDLPLIFGIGGITTLVLGPVIGHLSDRYGKFRVFAAGTILAASIAAVYSRSGITPLWLVVAWHVILFTGINARMISSTALTTAMPDQRDRGAFMALDASLQQVAGGVAAAAAGLLVRQSADGMMLGYPSLGAVVIAVMLITMGLMQLINGIIARKR